MANLTDIIDSKRVELRKIRKDMTGINPSLSLYKELEKKARQIEIHISDLQLTRLQDKEDEYE